MFGLFATETASDPEFIAALKCAAVENRLRARLGPLLEPAGREIEDTNTQTEFCAAATIAVIHLVLERAGRETEQMPFEQRFVVGLFAFLVAHDLSRRVDADLGIVLAAAALELFSKDQIHDIYRLGSSYRRLRQHRPMHKVLRETIADFVDDPSEAKLMDLAVVFECCLAPQH